MARMLICGLTGLLAAFLAGCGAAPRVHTDQVDAKPRKGQLCRFERGNCQTILIVDELPAGGVGAR